MKFKIYKGDKKATSAYIYVDIWSLFKIYLALQMMSFIFILLVWIGLGYLFMFLEWII